MQTLLLIVLAALTLTAAAFVHKRLATVAGRGAGLMLTRAILVLAGTGF